MTENRNPKFEKFKELIDKRARMESDCTDPDEWYKLSQEFMKIGSYSNQARCQERAEHYAQNN